MEPQRNRLWFNPVIKGAEPTDWVECHTQHTGHPQPYAFCPACTFGVMGNQMILHFWIFLPKHVKCVTLSTSILIHLFQRNGDELEKCAYTISYLIYNKYNLINVQYTLRSKVLVAVSYPAHRGCLYLIKNTVNICTILKHYYNSK